MITNIVDKRTDKYNILCDAVYEPSWHDNNVSAAGTLFPQDDTFTYDELPRTSITAAIRYANEKWPEVPTTLYLYDWESLTKSYTAAGVEVTDVIYPDQLDLFDLEEDAAGC